MPLDILAVFVIAAIIGDWMKKALADGVITAREGVDLIMALGDELGLPLDQTLLDLREPPPPESDTEADVVVDDVAAAGERPDVPEAKGIV